MNTLQSMRIFVRVAETGSFTVAGKRSHLTAAAVSRAISDLESHLQVRLLNRTTRRTVLTEAGSRYLQRCMQILAYIDEAEAEAGESQAAPSGRLRVYVWTSFGQHYVVPAVAHYQQRYPDVHVEVTLAQRMPDLQGEGYDVVLMLANKVPNCELVSHQLGSVFSVLCASPAYLNEKGIPQVPSDLLDHACMEIANPVTPPGEWTFFGPAGQETLMLETPPFRVNISEAMAVAVREGMGVALLPIYSAIAGLRKREIVRILPEYTAQEMNVYALYLPRQYLDAKVRTFVEHLREALPAALEADRAALRNCAAARRAEMVG